MEIIIIIRDQLSNKGLLIRGKPDAESRSRWLRSDRYHASIYCVYFRVKYMIADDMYMVVT